MTQQFDLALNMANTTDKMMSNSSSLYSSKDNQSEMSTKFGDMLDNANKSYSKSTNTDSKNVSQNKTVKHKEEKNDGKKEIFYDKNEKNVSANDTKDNNKADNEVNTAVKFDEKTDVKETMTELPKTTDFSETEVVADCKTDDLFLMNNIFPISTVELPNIEISNFEPTELVLPLETIEDLPVGNVTLNVDFEPVLLQEDVKAIDTSVVDSLTKDMTVSKEDLIASIYNAKTVDDTKATKSEKTVDLKVDNQDLKQEVIKETPVVEKMNVELPKEQAVKNVSVEEKVDVSAKTEDLPMLDKEIESVKDDLKVETKEQEVLPVKNQEFEPVKEISNSVIEDKTDEIVVPNQDINENDIKFEEKVVTTEVKNTSKEENFVNKLPEKDTTEQKVVNLENIKMVSVVSDHSEEVKPQENIKEEYAAVAPKVQELKQEVQSATLENAVNVAQNNSDKTVAEKDAKTNVTTKETKAIKDDVSGIEFVDNKTEDVTNKQDVTDEVQKENVKQRVETVKIQVEENIKINPQIAKPVQEENKMVKAQETLDKAGLSTENLQKMDAKVTAIEDSKSNSGFEFKQSSQEMLMRDMLQSAEQSTNNDSVMVKTDFNQTLNKVSQTTNSQFIQQQNEAPEVNILDQIRAKFAANSSNGLQKITIGLTPESLGKLSIEIAKGQDGISAQIVATNPQAKEILDKNIENLKTLLQSQGVNVNNVNVKVSEAGRASDSNNNMFNDSESQFDSNQNGKNSKNSDNPEGEKQANYEFLQKEFLQKEVSAEPELLEGLESVEKTVNLNIGTGNVSYKL